MELKAIKATSVTITTDGKINIEQWSNLLERPVEIQLTLEQFNNIETFVFKNKDEIELAWNEGVEDDSNS